MIVVLYLIKLKNLNNIYSNLFFRVDNVDQASQAKAEIEQKQRNEAEVRKESNEVWIPRVNKINNIYFK